jgi:3-hydroxyisobutyrate dehydrogenase/glyoxylate/succinic semialdehyde reductase
MNVGFIGMGIMGSRMARNLLSEGYRLTIYNRTPDKASHLLKAGAKWAETPADLAKKIDILFTMLSTPEVVQRLATGQNGFIEAMPEDSLWVDCSTVNPGFSRKMASLASKRAVHFLEAPVAGTKGPAKSGELMFFVGGNAQDLDRCRPLLECMGKKMLFLGDHGQAAGMKMLFNLMLGSAMAAYSEALVLGEALGFTKEKIAEVVLSGPVAAPFLKLKQPLIENGEFDAHFPLCWMRKDLHLATQTAYENGVALPALNAIKEIYAVAEKKGLGESDFSSIYEYLAE